MSNASKKQVGAGAQGKGDGSGALGREASVPENMILSNRDKKQHADGRGLDSKHVQTEQSHDHELNQDKR
jgi:hypothetical protein